MSSPDGERIAKLEAHYDHLAEKVEAMDGKLDDLLKAANMGKGAWWLLLKVGGSLTILAGAIAWVWDHLPGNR